MYYANGEKYIGDWVDDLKNGKGIYYFGEDESYDGEFLADKFHGKGTAYFSNGSKYTGVWENGVVLDKENELDVTKDNIDNTPGESETNIANKQ